ncbi:hypothetical protein BDD12DRAFT_796787, partial [Trichophaea hybrida]
MCWQVKIAVTLVLAGSCEAVSHGGDEYSNNIISDLAPLLALFGEQVTRQFMAESLGWADNIVLAVCPLGIITIIVSAIRVGGPAWLRAIIGRARENRAVAEVELMSSTSHEVCELWNGRQVVRIIGSPPIKEFICFSRSNGGDGNVERDICSLEEACDRGYLIKLEARLWLIVQTVFKHEEIAENGDSENPRTAPKAATSRPCAPNISLNLHNRTGRAEICSVAIVGILLQIGVLVYSGLARYHPIYSFKKSQGVLPVYAFPFTMAGTLMLVFGLLICSHIVEASSVEEKYRVQVGGTVRIVWLQQSETVSDQSFDSFALLAKGPRTLIITSRRNIMPSVGAEDDDDRVYLHTEILTTATTIVSVCGFLMQFVGLRAMHWSVTVAQLGATVAMTILRSVVRRGLSTRPHFQQLPNSYEIDWLATRFGNDPDLLEKENDSISWFTRVFRMTVPRAKRIQGKSIPGNISRAHQVLHLRKTLGSLTGWTRNASNAMCVANAIEVAMNAFFTFSEFEQFTWSVKSLSPDQQEIQFKLIKSDGKWYADAGELEAALSLQLYAVLEKERKDLQEGTNRQSDAWLRKGAMSRQSIRILGPDIESLRRDLGWWMPSEHTTRIISAERMDISQPTLLNEDIEISNHRAVGFGMTRPTGTSSRYTIRELHDLGPRSTEESSASLAVVSDSTLSSLFAQDLFSCFIWSVAKAIPPISSPADVQLLHSAGVTKDVSYKSFKVRNSMLLKVVQDIHTAGLGSVEEVYLDIIPPLSMESKLPQPMGLIDVAREEAKKYELLGKWKEAGDVYMWLFETCIPFGNKTLIATRATALLVEFFRTVISTLNIYQKQLDVANGQFIGILEDLRSNVASQLIQADGDALSGLVQLYTIQGRTRGYDNLQPECWKPLQIYNNTRLNMLESIEHAQLYHRAIDISFNYKSGNDLAKAQDILAWTPLHYSAVRGYKSEVEPLLRGGADPNAQDLSGYTPLHYASWHGHDTICWNLLEEGAHIDLQGRDGFTPLMCAALKGQQTTITLLVGAGANIDALDTARHTPLHWAAYFGHLNAAETLRLHGAHSNARDLYGMTPMHFAALTERADIVRMFCGADVNAVSQQKQTALHFAVSVGVKSVVKMLVEEASADIDPEDMNKNTPLHHALMEGHHDIAQLLINCGANTNIKDNSGKTALHHAIAEGHYATEEHRAIIVALVTNPKTDVNAKDADQYNVLHYAAIGGHKQ